MQKVQCSDCGRVMWVNGQEEEGLPPVVGAGWSPVQRRQVGMGAASAFAPTEYERIQPTRPASIGSDIAVPMLSALITAVALTGVFAVAAWAWSLPAWLVALGGLLAFLFTWLLLSAFSRSLLVQSEYQRAEPAPVAAEQPPAQVKRVRLEIVDDAGKRRQYADLPIEVDALTATARAIQAGRAFSVASLTGRGQPLSRSQFCTLRDWMISNDNQYAAWVDPANRQAGVKFTRRGKALLRALAE